MCHLPKLHTLNISGNVQLNLWDLEAFFQNLTQIRSLSMADISNIPMDFFMPLAKLHSLNVSGTRLGNETSQLLEPLRMLKVNPIRHLILIILKCLDWDLCSPLFMFTEASSYMRTFLFAYNVTSCERFYDCKVYILVEEQKNRCVDENGILI